MSMSYIKHLLGIVLIASVGFAAQAQQDVMFTQYMFNGLALNPAYAGSHNALSATALIRKQWVGIDGAPFSQTLSVHSPFKDERMGVGFQVVNDKIGISKETNLYGAYSYWIPVGAGRLSMGLQAGINLFGTDFSQLDLKHDSDIDFSQGNLSELKPNFGAGLYYYTERLYLGLSVPRLVENKFGDDAAGNTFQQARHYFLTGGYVFDLGPNWKFKPNFLIKTVPGAPVELDLNANFLFIEKLWMGVSWRSFDSFDLLAQFFITDQLSLGYAYDITTTKLRGYTSGSHELMLNYVFKFSEDKMLTPRYF